MAACTERYCDGEYLWIFMADEIKTIVSKVSEGLNFFDFSFFVSGFMTFCVLCNTVNVLFYRFIYFSTFVDYLIAVVFIYICGIISFISGKFLRSKIRKKMEVAEEPTKWYQIRSFDYIFVNTLSRLNIPLINEEIPSDSSLAYSQMWSVIRQKDTSGKCYQYLYRQWVMQAVCEGLFFSFLLLMVFSIVLPIYEWTVNDSSDDLPLYVVSLIFSIICILACLREAQRYAENQIKEVLISYMIFMGKLSGVLGMKTNVNEDNS